MRRFIDLKAALAIDILPNVPLQTKNLAAGQPELVSICGRYWFSKEATISFSGI
jgi:hypothetical protein